MSSRICSSFLVKIHSIRYEGERGKVSLSVYDYKHNGKFIQAYDTNGKRVSLALSKLTNIYFDSDFDLYEEESESEDYELLCEAQQWEELQYFCK
ncbi:hypothetical protein TVAG_382810 [Trichomonas vaginalis G3]|uniref:Uncharacterized protein n=1 Tax=Trichomonas vaginalis (strain ATCC PRA-98 / G3) TaxID=412133 RepID=A2FJK9_TRIV3|nr:hypothetical protein TVAG_382810 [Trichomonas vaginalis G3]|eukprot:XP_001307826.1 hypothetical protein [Trichomonas vaginalis G3]